MYKKNYHTHIHMYASMHYERGERGRESERDFSVPIHTLNENDSQVSFDFMSFEKIF